MNALVALVKRLKYLCNVRLFYKKKYSEKQHLVKSRFELLKTRQQFCGDISTLLQSHCQIRITAIFKTGSGESGNRGIGNRGIWESGNQGIRNIRILFRPILTQIVYIRLLNFRGQFLIA